MKHFTSIVLVWLQQYPRRITLCSRHRNSAFTAAFSFNPSACSDSRWRMHHRAVHTFQYKPRSCGIFYRITRRSVRFRTCNAVLKLLAKGGNVATQPGDATELLSTPSSLPSQSTQILVTFSPRLEARRNLKRAEQKRQQEIIAAQAEAERLAKEKDTKKKPISTVVWVFMSLNA